MQRATCVLRESCSEWLTKCDNTQTVGTLDPNQERCAKNLFLQVVIACALHMLLVKALQSLTHLLRDAIKARAYVYKVTH